MKYYFLTYQAKNNYGEINIWNQVINGSPMAFIKNVEAIESESKNPNYRCFTVINTLEITKDEYEKYHNEF